jgi:predicted ferric reductase
VGYETASVDRREARGFCGVELASNLQWRAALNRAEDIRMLMTIVVILLVLWLLGMVTQYTLGGILHILLVVAVIVLLIRVIRGRPI